LVDVLRFRDCLDIIFEDFGEEILEFGTSEMLQDLLPFGWVVVSSEIGLEFTGKDLEGGRFTDTVGTDQTENLTWTGSRETMQLESVGVVSVSDVRVEVGWQVENLDRFEWAPIVSVDFQPRETNTRTS
jgi:hypothetical protein